jgi:hypothetical protein
MVKTAPVQRAAARAVVPAGLIPGGGTRTTAAIAVRFQPSATALVTQHPQPLAWNGSVTVTNDSET